MACYKPMHIPSGDKKQEVPCGKCIGCRLERSRQWAVRCMNEADMHENNQFVTLTYKDEELVWGNSRPTLYPRHLQLFMKKLRKQEAKKQASLKFFACGEYGEENQRPHYHALIFGLDLTDRKYSSTRNGNRYYTSDYVENVWGHGGVIIGDVTFESAAYVARYLMAKKTGKQSVYYEEQGIQPEFVRMSRGGKDGRGIGYSWYEKYHGDIFPHDYMVSRGVKVRPPQYYSKLYSETDPEEMEYIKEKRHAQKEATFDDNLGRRLRVKEAVKLSQLRMLKRDL